MDFTGVAIGSGVNQYMKMDEMARANKKLEMEKQLADQQLERGNIDLDRLRSFDTLNKERQAVNKAIAAGTYMDDPTAQQWLANSNLNRGPHNDGTVTRFERGDSGYMMNTYGKDNKLINSVAPSADALYGAADTYFGRQLSTLSPESYIASRRLDQEDRKNDIFMQHYGRPTFMQDGTGRIIAINQQGEQIGTYGSARPQSGGGSGSMGQLLGPTADRSGLIYNTPQGIVTRPLPQGVSADDLFPKATGVKGPTNPEDNKEWRAAKVGLGPRPEAQAGWFGGTSNQKAIDNWNAQNDHIDKVYGVTQAQPSVPSVPTRRDDPIAASKKPTQSAAPSDQPENPKRGLPNPRSRLPQNMRGTADPNGVYPSYTYGDLNPR